MKKAYLFIKKYQVDAGLIVLFLLCAFLFAERPKAESGNRGIGESSKDFTTDSGCFPDSPTPRFSDSAFSDSPTPRLFDSAFSLDSAL